MGTIFNAMDKMSKQPGLFERAIRQLVGGHARGPQDAAMLINMHHGAQRLEESAKDVFNALRDRVPKKLRPMFSRDFADYAAGKRGAVDALKIKYPEVWSEIEDFGQKLLMERDANNAELVKLGFVPDDLTPLIEKGILDRYLTRNYLSYVLPPGEWAKYVHKYRPDVIENAAAYFKHKFPKWTEFNIAEELTRILHAEDPLDAYMGSPLAYHGKAAKALQRRGNLSLEVRKALSSGTPDDIAQVLARTDVSDEVKALVRKGNYDEALGLSLKQADIPEQLRALMGEVESGEIKLATTLGNQRANLAIARMWTEITQSPEMFSRSWREGLHPVPLPDSKRHFGPAAYSDDKIRPAMADAQERGELRTQSGHLDRLVDEGAA